MPSLLTSLIDPVERFRSIYHALHGEAARWWSDNAWLRFAAQSAALHAADPTTTAHAIRAVADQLRERSRWYEPLASSLSLVVAAVLVQNDDDAESFHRELEAARLRFHAAGLPRGGTPEAMAILALRVLYQRQPIGEALVARLHAIHQRMRAHHWWLTGRDDLPACAWLTTCRGSPEAIADLADAIYVDLHEHGFRAGNQLQAVANLLPLAGLAASAISQRFRALTEAFAGAGVHLWHEDLDAVALLALLDHPAEELVERFREVLARLEELEPRLVGDVDVPIACDLAFLDALQDDARGGRLSPAETDRLLRQQRAAALALVRVPQTLVTPAGGPPLIACGVWCLGAL